MTHWSIVWLRYVTTMFYLEKSTSSYILIIKSRFTLFSHFVMKQAFIFRHLLMRKETIFVLFILKVTHENKQAYLLIVKNKSLANHCVNIKPGTFKRLTFLLKSRASSFFKCHQPRWKEEKFIARQKQDQ